MAISMCPDNSSLTSSPRISFSHDLHQTDIVPIEDYPYRSDSSLLSPNSDFDFPISNTFENEPSSADELFSKGLIRPLELHQKFVTSKQPSLSLTPLPLPSNETPNQEISKQIVSKNTIGDSSESHQIQKHQSKSFWRIKRSSSLHCDNTCKKSSFWSLPLLSRSNSTGSLPVSKNSSKDNNQKQIPLNSQKQPKNSSLYTYPHKPPPYQKNYGGAYGNGIRISPVLNVPPPFISKGTANLFGLGSFFCNGKDRKNKK